MAKNGSICLVALGGNLTSSAGSPLETLIAAVGRFPDHGCVIRALSRFFATPAFPAGAGPDYVNAAAVVQTALAPDALLAALHRIEAEFARERVERWGQRTLDLDLLAVGSQVLPDRQTFDVWHDLPPERQTVDTPDLLILPHPRMQDRGFVLIPLMDVAPHWRHPVLDRSVADLVAALPQSAREGVRPIRFNACL